MKTIINIDIQPKYEKWITFDVHKWVDYNNKIASSNDIVFLYNGKDTLGMIDEISLNKLCSLPIAGNYNTSLDGFIDSLNFILNDQRNYTR